MTNTSILAVITSALVNARTRHDVSSHAEEVAGEVQKLLTPNPTDDPAPRRFTAEELEALPVYTPVQGISRNGALAVLAHRSPNGLWWSTYENPVTVDALILLCNEGFRVLKTS